MGPVQGVLCEVVEGGAWDGSGEAGTTPVDGDFEDGAQDGVVVAGGVVGTEEGGASGELFGEAVLG